MTIKLSQSFKEGMKISSGQVPKYSSKKVESPSSVKLAWENTGKRIRTSMDQYAKKFNEQK